MDYLFIAIQVIAALGILNVWLLRFKQSTDYRGGDADDMKQEFKEYGLPGWLVWIVGALKVACALALLAGVVWPVLVMPAASLLGLLMLGALGMHLKVRDPIKKSLPALGMLALCLTLVLRSAI